MMGGLVLVVFMGSGVWFFLVCLLRKVEFGFIGFSDSYFV